MDGKLFVISLPLLCEWFMIVTSAFCDRCKNPHPAAFVNTPFTLNLCFGLGVFASSLGPTGKRLHVSSLLRGRACNVIAAAVLHLNLLSKAKLF